MVKVILVLVVGVRGRASVIGMQFRVIVYAAAVCVEAVFLGRICRIWAVR
jgi:hypothetical protein